MKKMRIAYSPEKHGAGIRMCRRFVKLWCERGNQVSELTPSRVAWLISEYTECEVGYLSLMSAATTAIKERKKDGNR